MSLKLQQKLSFQMIQSLKLLQVNTLQLEQILKNEIEMNPVLEAVEDSEDIQKEDTDDHDAEADAKEDAIDWEEYLDDGIDQGYNQREERDPNEEHFESNTVYDISLEEYLEEQLAERTLEHETELLVKFLIGCIEADGYLRISLEQISEVTECALEKVEEALKVIWTMEPSGVGARNLQECLVIQLDRMGYDDSLPMDIITKEWNNFEKLKIKEIAKRLGVEPIDVQEELELIKTLNPKPGGLVGGDNSSAITPDLIVEKIDGEFLVSLNDRSLPMLNINGSYANMLKRGSTVKKDIKKYVRDKFNSATWLIKSIEQRRSTMLKVMYAILERQREFFENGSPNLNPLKLQDIADMIEMHISTVSRVTSNKYVQCAQGVFELKHFFTESMGQDTEGEDVSTAQIKNRLKQLVDEEPKKKPLSDQKLSDILKKEGYNVARRTVAKYRTQLNILPARMRQKYE